MLRAIPSERAVEMEVQDLPHIIESAEKHVTELFREQLPEEAVYHSLEHTQFVVDKSREIGQHSGLTESELQLVELAAWFHDVGYLKQAKGHEDYSIKIAVPYLQNQGLNEDQIEFVVRCIEATRMPQQPKDLAGQVICDADLSHFGMAGMYDKTMILLKEMRNLCLHELEDGQWLQMTIDLLEHHEYFTPYARENFEEQKRINEKQIRQKLSEITPTH
ncbi:HD domain-containing protein [bacterium SCSIO 12741]|nr:HD domain-containing protein [bacterium SCSIO 12741]